MGEMEDKLNAILNDPSAMGQIMALAQSLGGGAPRPQASPAGEAALPETLRTVEGASAFVKISEGCDRFCAFCAIWPTRKLP